MSSTAIDTTHGHHGEQHQGFVAWCLRWITTTNHKDIGTLYLVSLDDVLRRRRAWRCDSPRAIPAGPAIRAARVLQLDDDRARRSSWFRAIMPAFVGFANWMIPMMIGAPDMALPRLNNWSVLAAAARGGLLLMSLFMPGGAPAGGWTLYPPLDAADRRIRLRSTIFAVPHAGRSSIMGSINIIATILNMRAPGMTLMKMPLFCWTWLITAYLLIAVMPVLAGAVTMLLTDRHFGT